jgi:AcrR family transcriptional regulator
MSHPQTDGSQTSGRRTAATVVRAPDGAGRDAIVKAAVEAFARYGYSKTTLQDVAARVGLTRTGLLHHFQSKDGLFIAAIEAGRDWAERQSAESDLVGGLAGLRAQRRFLRDRDDAIYVRFVHTLQAEALHEDAPPHVVKFAGERLKQIRAHVARCLEEAIASGEIGELDVSAVATLVAGAINGLQIEALLDDSLDTERALDALVDLLITMSPARERSRSGQ